jgi:PKD repeat protein
MPPALGSCVVFSDNIFLVGGWYDGSIENRIWYSPDGVTWAEPISESPWAPRWTSTLVFDNKLWSLGIRDAEGVYRSDVWYAKTIDAEFSAVPEAGDAPLTVQFTDESTWFSDPITSWSWNFGDGAWSVDPSPSHTYDVRGAYTVSLTVTSDSGEDTETKTNYIVVQGESHDYHSGDTNQNGVIDLSELLRLVQLFNLGGFHGEASTEDGYAPGTGDTSGVLHDSDYSPPDWQISFSELLRAVQLFQARRYYPCSEGEDGFCPGNP